METREITSDVFVLREQNERAVLVRGDRFATAIDIPIQRESLAGLVDASRELTGEGVRLAILTREPESADLPIDSLAGVRLFRADRKPDVPWKWDVVPQSLLKHPEVPVHLIRTSKTLFDDAGRAFRCEPRAGDRALTVRIDPEDILVVADDLLPDLPPIARAGAVESTIAQYERWLEKPPRVLLPAAGIPMEGGILTDTLRRSADYLKSLRSEIKGLVEGSRYPWERLVYVIHWADHWGQSDTSSAVRNRHRLNVRAVAEDVNLSLRAPEFAH